jgi:acyl-CoA thioesterase-1
MPDASSEPGAGPRGIGLPRRSLIRAAPLLLAAAGLWTGDAAGASTGAMLTVYTFGDSILDCGHYNDYGLDPGQLLVRNDDRLFPGFKGRDLQSRGPAPLVQRASDGATVEGLARQAH